MLSILILNFLFVLSGLLLLISVFHAVLVYQKDIKNPLVLPNCMYIIFSLKKTPNYFGTWIFWCLVFLKCLVFLILNVLVSSYGVIFEWGVFSA